MTLDRGTTGGSHVTDIAIYWAHRLHHQIGFLWRFHSIHHSSKKMDWISGIRAHLFDGFIIIGPAVFLLIAGFPLAAVGALAVVQAVPQVRDDPGVSPLAPANYPESIHTNYSVFRPVWDIIWGTYRMPDDQRPERYGVDDRIVQLVTATPAPRRSWWVAVSVALLFTLNAASGSGAALAFGPAIDPTHEVAIAGAMDGFRLFLVGSSTVFSASTAMLLIGSLLVPAGGAARIAWLLPSRAAGPESFHCAGDAPPPGIPAAEPTVADGYLTVIGRH